MEFDGDTIDQERDGERLSRQARTVFNLMRDGKWRTLFAIASWTGEPEASVSARLRDLRKPKFGGYTVDREYIADGVWQYRVRKPEAST